MSTPAPTQTSSQNYTTAMQSASTTSKTSPTTVKIPDGRRNSHGEVMASPTESWRPNYQRQQSWCQEDLKRELLVEKFPKGEVAGFTEGVGDRKS